MKSWSIQFPWKCGCGYEAKSWDEITQHLKKHQTEELEK